MTRRSRPLQALAVLAAVAVSSAGTARSATSLRSAGADAAALRTKGLELGFNLDYDEALAAFRAAIAADPTHPAAYRLVAATMWIHALFTQGAVTAEDYLGQVRSDVERRPMSPEVAAGFHTNIDHALALAEERLRDRPNDADAHFQVGAAYAFLTTYKATIEGRVVGGFRTARRAYAEHERALELDAARRDAGLTVGMYRYGVSTLSAPLRLLAGLVGFGGGRERGLRLIEEAAAYPSDVQANARFTLVVIYNREKQYDHALGVIRALKEQYPRNRLLWLEEGSTDLRARRFEDARVALEQGFARLADDKRPRAFGENARWHYYLGAALVGLKRSESGERELRQALAEDAPEWLRGRVHNELGKIADLAGRRSAALMEYQSARRVCRAQHDDTCANDARALIAAAYR